MNYTFSPATERVLQQAAQWARAKSELDGLSPALLALTLENECRAARLLAQKQIGPDDIRRRWPDLTARSETEPAPFPSADLQLAIRAVIERLSEYPQPLEVATEHLLLGMLDVPSEVADWLAEQGLSAGELQEEIHRLNDFSPGPIEVDWEAPATNGDVQAIEPAWQPEPPAPTIASHDNSGTLRILDAAANRAREALRVIEDFVRFALDDRHLTERFKRVRHDLATLLMPVSPEDLLAARETQGDVGTQFSLESERTRQGMDDVLAANFKRLQESLRSLEEYSKTISPVTGSGCEQLRYQVYTLERAVMTSRASTGRLQQARLYVLIDGRANLADFEALAEQLVQSGVHVLQLRDKCLDDRRLLERGRRLRSMTAGTNTLFVMNDRPDLAALCRADGVHVGQEELPVKEVRSIVGSRVMVGVSTHSIQQARQAVVDGADYIGVGPTFPSKTKSFDAFTGLALLEQVRREIRLPAFAIGGIDLSNLPAVQATGCERVAVSGAILNAADPAAAARQFLSQLTTSRPSL